MFCFFVCLFFVCFLFVCFCLFVFLFIVCFFLFFVVCFFLFIVIFLSQMNLQLLHRKLHLMLRQNETVLVRKLILL